MAQKFPPLKERFEAKIRITPGCWIWTGGKRKTGGYGIITNKNRQFVAHRVSYSLYVGEIPEGKVICHKCDIPLCVNPDHLFAGTTQDNVSDRVAKGRSANNRGGRSPLAKLTMDQARAIRKDPRSNRETAKNYGVSPSVIWFIRTGKKYIEDSDS